MLKKLVLMMVALLLTVSVAPLTNACASVRFNDVIILFANGLRLSGNDRQYVKTVSTANDRVIGYGVGKLHQIDNRIQIKETFDTVVSGISARVPQESLAEIKKLGFHRKHL